MAITKTANDLIGTSASKQTVAASGTAIATARDVSDIIGIVIHCLVTYGATAPDSDPLIEIFTSPDNANFDTYAYVEEDVPRSAGNDQMVSIPLGPEVKYFKVKITNGASQSIDVWISDVEMKNE